MFICKQTQLYRFLNYCNDLNLDKSVLDCGAGGNYPPLTLFWECGYKTYGIEYSDAQIKKAENFSKDHNIDLNITKGDIREIPFDDNSISYIYSYNTIFHLNKKDIAKGIREIKRVLKPGGICFVNFLSINDCDYGKGTKIGEGVFLQGEGDGEVIHTYYEIDEGDMHFQDMKILVKENRILERIYQGEKIKQGFIDYIVQK
ncbi:class I SAM-dependent methyltransferase [Vallitalea guaymasensis]|uniref:class I SAM-dependent methyltransferase n=1 Tax=Vallitalea guaymasensis TaxID=1185412 RepID=UPI0023579AAF|nr:class I SAM-dependent methyltransferase [Vallitalea guaymasensis]